MLNDLKPLSLPNFSCRKTVFLRAPFRALSSLLFFLLDRPCPDRLRRYKSVISTWLAAQKGVSEDETKMALLSLFWRVCASERP